MKPIEFFFDLSSPWTYLAFHNIQPIARAHNASLRWRPILVGGVFNAVNPAVYSARESPDNPRMRHTFKVLKDWAAWSNLPLNFPSPHHPAKSVLPMRACCVLEDRQEVLQRFATAVFEAYCVGEENIDDPAVIARLGTEIGEEGEALVERAGSQAIKDHLRANTQEVVDRGGYGSPTIFVDGNDMYFGNDQLPLVELALQRR